MLAILYLGNKESFLAGHYNLLGSMMAGMDPMDETPVFKRDPLHPPANQE
jgi:hypothetical protein